MALKLKILSFKNWKNIFTRFKRKKKISISECIADSECIVRVLLFPKHVTNNELSIRTIAYRSPGDMDEVSVIRHTHSGTEFCRNWGRKIEDNKNPYYGFGVHAASEIRDLKSNVIYTPEGNHVYHADITVGHIFEKGKEPPPEIKYKTEQLAIKARLLKDPNPKSKLWMGAAVA